MRWKSLILFLLLAASTKTEDTNQCLENKTVGGACFTLVDQNDVETAKYNCANNCVYEDNVGDQFCFRKGPYEVEKGCSSCRQTTFRDVEGSQCNRDCTADPLDNKTCHFTFDLEQTFSDQDGRYADGNNRSVLTYNKAIPGPTIVVCQGDIVKIKLRNKLEGSNSKLNGGPENSTTLHFHGIAEKQPECCKEDEDCGPGWTRKGGPWSDGVPQVTQCPVPSGKSFDYTFGGENGAPAGTYWYHSHVGRQRMNGAQGKLIIMERERNRLVDVDDPDNSLFLQEWYPDTDDHIPQSLLVNGKGKLSNHMYVIDEDKPHCIKPNCQANGQEYEVNCGTLYYKRGNIECLKKVENPSYNNVVRTNYEVFNINEYNKLYRFRIIGAIGDDVPIRVSIEKHTFTAIATDSQDIEPVSNLSALWVSGGERYDIVIRTKTEEEVNSHPDAYKINVIHKKTHNSGAKLTICTLAWLNYKKTQSVNHEIEADCEAMSEEKLTNILNAVPNDFSNWVKQEYIYPHDLRAKRKATTINKLLNTQYITMYPSYKFNNFSSWFPHIGSQKPPPKYPRTPILFQSPPQRDKYCGVSCTEWKWDPKKRDWDTKCKPFPVNCSDDSEKEQCYCQHIIEQPWIPVSKSGQYWFEIVLINNQPEFGVAHPIHHHGGWFNILGADQFPNNSNISREKIIEMDMNGELNRNYDRPVFKDVIQVPTNGYVIFRVPVDNRGAWIVHCHINWHVEHGMAMYFKIGEPDGPFRWSMGPNKQRAKTNKNKECPDPPPCKTDFC